MTQLARSTPRSFGVAGALRVDAEHDGGVVAARAATTSTGTPVRASSSDFARRQRANSLPAGNAQGLFLGRARRAIAILLRTQHDKRIRGRQQRGANSEGTAKQPGARLAGEKSACLKTDNKKPGRAEAHRVVMATTLDRLIKSGQQK